MVVKHHLQVHVNVNRDKIMSRRIYAYKVRSAQHDLCVVDEEEGEEDDSVVRVNYQNHMCG